MRLHIKVWGGGLLISIIAFTSVATAESFLEKLSSGQKKLQAKDYAGAQAEGAAAQKLAGTVIEKSEALLLQARSLAAAGDLAGALVGYRRIAEMNDVPAELKAQALVAGAKLLAMDQKWFEVRRELEKVLVIPGALPERIKSEVYSRIAEAYFGEEDFAGMRGAVEKLLDLSGSTGQKVNFLLKLGDLAMKKNMTVQAREIYGKVSIIAGTNEQQKAHAALRITHSFAEEGTVPPGLTSCDPFGLPRESQQVNFDTGTAGYLKAHPEAKFALGIETPVRKLFRDKLWFQGEFVSQVALSAARNEYEAFQLCVVPLQTADPEPVKGVRLTATDLIGENGAKIPAANVKIWQVGYVRTGIPSYPTCHVGYWPDPLLEHDAPLDVDGHQLQAFWIRVYVAEGIAPGQYQGGIKVATDTLGSQTLTIKLRVRAFTLPKDPKLIFHTLRYLELKPYMNYYQISADAARDVVKQYTETLIGEYKLFPAAASFYDKGDTDFSRFDAQLQPLIQKGMKLLRCLPRVKFEGLSRGIEPAEFKRLTDHLRQKGWLDKTYVYCLSDEPSEAQYPKLREYAAKLKELVPDVKILTSESPYPGLVGFTDAWWSDVSTEDPAYNRERQKAGDLVLWYFCRVPIHMDRIYNSIWDSPLMLIDRAATEQRVAFWLAWKYKIDGIMIWAGNGSWYKKGKTTWPEEPWDPYIDTYAWPYGGADNGNGVLFYPGKHGPLPSVRLEVLREGREDYEYLWLLNDLAGDNPPEDIKQALAVNPLVCVTPHMFTKDPAIFYKERDKIADLIENHQK